MTKIEAATDEQIEKAKRIWASIVANGRPYHKAIEDGILLIARIDSDRTEIATLKAEVERLRGREGELIDRLSCIYSSLEDMWLSDDFRDEFHEESDDESTLVRYSLFTGEVWMIHKILAPLRRTRQECFLRQSGGDNGK